MPSTIYISETADRVGFVNKVFEIFRGEIGDQSVLLKPNVVSYEEYPTTTHPAVLGTLFDLLKGNRVAAGDGPAVDLLRSAKIIAEHPLQQVCKTKRRELLNLHDLKMTDRKSPRGLTLIMSAVPADYAYVISLPILKSHSQCLITGALKNQFGYLARSERALLHLGKKNIHPAIAELNVLQKPDLFIVDAVITETVTNEIRHGGKPTALGFMLAGKDPVALDAYGLSLMQRVDEKLQGLKPHDIPYIKMAEEYGVGSTEYKVEKL